ncbi:MAG: PD-(D/E)XK nuclease family protein [Rubripirellula sp.]
MTNIIDVLLSTHDEEKYHSRALTWLVDPHGNHGLGRSFFDTLLELAFPGWQFDDVLQVRAELSLDASNTVDVGVLGERQFFMIENKTRFSSITDGQVKRYLEAARTKARDKEIRLIHLLPGPPKEFPHLETHGPEVAVVFWAQIAEILRSLISTESVSDVALPSAQMYYDYLIRTIAQGAATIGLHPDHPRMSLSRSGFTTNFGLSRNDYLAESRTDCAEHPERLDLIHAFIGFLENLRLVRVEYKKGKSHWNVTGSIPPCRRWCYLHCSMLRKRPHLLRVPAIARHTSQRVPANDVRRSLEGLA